MSGLLKAARRVLAQTPLDDEISRAAIAPYIAIGTAVHGDDLASRQHRVALLRIHHAAENAEERLEDLAGALSEYLVDPDGGSAEAILEYAATRIADQLAALASEIRKSVPEIRDLAQHRWAQIALKEEGLNDGVQRPTDRGPTSDERGEQF